MKISRRIAKARRRIVRALMRELAAARRTDPRACLYYPDRSIDDDQAAGAVDAHLRWCRRFGRPMGRDRGPLGVRVVRSDTSSCAPTTRTRTKR